MGSTHFIITSLPGTTAYGHRVGWFSTYHHSYEWRKTPPCCLVLFQVLAIGQTIYNYSMLKKCIHDFIAQPEKNNWPRTNQHAIIVFLSSIKKISSDLKILRKKCAQRKINQWVYVVGLHPVWLSTIIWWLPLLWSKCTTPIQLFLEQPYKFTTNNNLV